MPNLLVLKAVIREKCMRSIILIAKNIVFDFSGNNLWNIRRHFVNSIGLPETKNIFLEHSFIFSQKIYKIQELTASTLCHFKPFNIRILKSRYETN